mmetsp:Transcript_89651/g.159228  ORF Transcript_89651/g.159228 Transcript_89651/m.159228 type:complete len:676 (-) Transcript_89651:115-2142(-)
MPEICDADGQLSAVSATVRDQLRELLVERGSGSLLRGWRAELDHDFHQRVRLEDLQRAVAHLGGIRSGEAALRVFFSESTSIGLLSLVDLDQTAAVLATRFKRWAASLGNPRQVFFGDDKEGYKSAKQLTEAEFIETCQRLDFNASHDELWELFGFCDVSEDGTIEPVDLIFLEPDTRIREKEEERLRMLRLGDQEEVSRLMADVFIEEKERKVSNKHRLAPRPWQAKDFEHLPQVIVEKKSGWLMDQQRKNEEARANFIRYLRKEYGCEVRAWRRALDPKGTYRLTLNGLRMFCRSEIHLRGMDPTSLWKVLDKDGQGSIGLEELCLQYGQVLANFRQFLQEQLGSCAAAWDHPAVQEACLGPQRDGLWKSTRKLLVGPFAKVIRELGWPAIDIPEARSMMLASMDFFGCGFVSRTDMEWLDGWEPPEWLNSKPDPEAWAQLKALVDSKYSHPLLAWRTLFDRDDSNSVSWPEFQAACKKLGFAGRAGDAWRYLDDDLSMRISLQEFDKGSADVLMSFKKWCVERFGSVEFMFRTLDRDGGGSLTYTELRKGCRRYKWKGDAHLLFNCIDIDRDKSEGKRSISLQEISFLDSWEGAGDDDGKEEVAATSPGHAPRAVSALLSPTKRGQTKLPRSDENHSLPSIHQQLKHSKSAPALPQPSRMLNRILDSYAGVR